MNEHRLALVSGSGRCGTLSVAGFVDGLPTVGGGRAMAAHETRFDAVVDALIRRRDDVVASMFNSFTHDIEVSPLIALFPASFFEMRRGPYVALIRDGRETIRSGYSKSWYFNENDDPNHWSNVLPRFPGDRFEQCCYYWGWVYRRLRVQGALIVRVEDLRDDLSTRARMLDKLGLRPTQRAFPHRHVGARSKWDAANRGVHRLPGWRAWGPGRRATFSAACGDVMDEWYPGWREW